METDKRNYNLFRRELVRAINEWAESHPSPDAPILIDGHNLYSPRRIAREVRMGTKFGRFISRTTYELGKEFQEELGVGGIIAWLSVQEVPR